MGPHRRCATAVEAEGDVAVATTAAVAVAVAVATTAAVEGDVAVATTAAVVTTAAAATGIGVGLQVGDLVKYFSSTHSTWMDTHVIDIDGEGEIILEIKPKNMDEQAAAGQSCPSAQALLRGSHRESIAPDITRLSRTFLLTVR